MRDLFNSINPIPAVYPVATAANDTAVVGQIIDRQGYESLTYVLSFGAIPDVDATFTILLEEGDVANLSDATAVADADLLGTEALAAPLFSDDNKNKKLGYIGSKRYTRITITPANNTSATLVAVNAVLGFPAKAPTANPPA